MLENYKQARKLTRVGMFGNILLVGLVLLQVFKNITSQDAPFLVLVVVFGIFIYIVNVKSIALHNAAIKDIESKLEPKPMGETK